MQDPNFLKSINKIASIYPGTDNAYSVNVIGSDNKVFETTIKSEEADLVLYLKTVVYPKLKGSEQKELLEFIDKYGDSRYDEGAFNESYEG